MSAFSVPEDGDDPNIKKSPTSFVCVFRTTQAVRVAGGDVEFAAIGLQDQIAGSAADRDVGEQNVFWRRSTTEMSFEAPEVMKAFELSGRIAICSGWRATEIMPSEASEFASSSEIVESSRLDTTEHLAVGRDARDPRAAASAASRYDGARSAIDRNYCVEPDAATIGALAIRRKIERVRLCADRNARDDLIRSSRREPTRSRPPN